MKSVEEESSLVTVEPKKAVLVRISISTSSICGWCSCLSGIVGVILLTWWLLRHKQSNAQLWMVPFGLVLFATPAVVWFSVFASGTSPSSSSSSSLHGHGDDPLPSRLVIPNDSVHDPER